MLLDQAYRSKKLHKVKVKIWHNQSKMITSNYLILFTEHFYKVYSFDEIRLIIL